jgi:hypothetical protein
LKSASPPLRFLAMVIGGWIFLRATVFGIGWWEARPSGRPVLQAVAPPLLMADRGVETLETVETARALLHSNGATLKQGSPLKSPVAKAPVIHMDEANAAPAAFAPFPPASSTPIALAALGKPARRWSASAWLFARSGGQAAIVPGGTLGGSQAGGRLLYRLNEDQARPLAASLRFYTPLDNLRGAEAAAGFDWQPVASMPLHLLAERRQKLGRDGRSAFAATFYGGVSDKEMGFLLIDAYGQAGIVGIRSRDLFADGSAKLGVPIGRIKTGAGAWGATQPGVSRLDAGPQVSVRLPLGQGSVTVAADWRLRLAGDAEPRDGPTLTLATDF